MLEERNRVPREFAVLKERVDNLLRERLEAELEEARKVAVVNEEMYRYMLEFATRGGKRLRPILMICAYHAVGGEETEEIVKASTSIEFLESYLLIHDDLIDRDDVRRGGPTYHRMAEGWYRGSFGASGAEHFGLAMAIMAGDFFSSLTTETLLRARFAPELKVRAVEELMKIQKVCLYGEIFDVILEKRREVTEEDYLKMVALKSASYTTTGPLTIGAILGGATERQTSTLKDYGLYLGQAFQIQDDILGTFGDPSETGKPTDSDLKEGKKTLLVIRALELAGHQEREFLQRSLGNSSIAQEDVEQMKRIILGTGVLEYSRKRATELKDRAIEVLEKGSFITEWRKALIDIAEYIVSRRL